PFDSDGFLTWNRYMSCTRRPSSRKVMLLPNISLCLLARIHAITVSASSVPVAFTALRYMVVAEYTPAWIIVGIFLVLSEKRLLHLRVWSFRSQYQASVTYMPCVACSPRLWMSLTNTSSPARFWVLVKPNSLAALIELMVSPPALASPTILAFEACACSRNEEKSLVLSGWRTLPRTLPPFASTAAAVSRSSACPNA